MSRNRARVRLLLFLMAAVVCPRVLMAQPGPPVIRSATLDIQGNTTTRDRHTLTIQYDHPAATGNPIPFYRIRTWPASRQAPSWGPYQPNTNRAFSFPVQLYRQGGYGPPIPGVHTVEVQIRDAGGRESNVRTVGVIREVAAVATTAQYRVQGAEVATLMGVSRSAGYRLVAEPMAPNSSCEALLRDGYWTLYVKAGNPFGATGPVPGTVMPRCRFRLFVGKALSAGWSLRSADLRPVPGYDVKWVIEHPIKPGSTDASFSIAATNGSSNTAHGFIRVAALVFDGPVNSEWGNAFRP